uniref:Uncharacterized protein n=1 Tax=viral metagenome TaxID=1070528 RepID=A0A6C0BPD2_9ZZZZ
MQTRGRKRRRAQEASPCLAYLPLNLCNLVDAYRGAEKLRGIKTLVCRVNGCIQKLCVRGQKLYISTMTHHYTYSWKDHCIIKSKNDAQFEDPVNRGSPCRNGVVRYAIRGQNVIADVPFQHNIAPQTILYDVYPLMLCVPMGDDRVAIMSWRHLYLWDWKKLDPQKLQICETTRELQMTIVALPDGRLAVGTDNGNVYFIA